MSGRARVTSETGDMFVIESKPEAAPSALAPGGSSSASKATYSDALQPRGEHVASGAPRSDTTTRATWLRVGLGG